MILCTVGLGYFTEQSEFPLIAGFFGPFFLSYLLVISTTPEQLDLKYWLRVAILLRLLLIVCVPGLSDDIYRFIWDGRLSVAGVSPFEMTPKTILESGQQIPGITTTLFELLNSPGYFSVYPPVCQAVFAAGAYLFPEGGILGSVLVVRAVILLAEIGTLTLLPRLLNHTKLPASHALIYSLNPLIIIELTGNLHPESLMIFFVALTFLLLHKQKILTAAVAFALAVCSKLLPLLLLPFFARLLGWGRFWIFCFITVLVSTIMFVPWISLEGLGNILTSLDLYFQKFEFNASVYYQLRWLGYQWKGYNMIGEIGPAMAVVTFFSVLFLAFRTSGKDWAAFYTAGLFAMTIYLVLATTVHPWYLSMLIFLSVFTSFRYPILWSNLIFLTYIHYQAAIFQENLLIVAVEYLLVGGWFFMEWKRHKAQVFNTGA